MRSPSISHRTFGFDTLYHAFSCLALPGAQRTYNGLCACLARRRGDGALQHTVHLTAARSCAFTTTGGGILLPAVKPRGFWRQSRCCALLRDERGMFRCRGVFVLFTGERRHFVLWRERTRKVGAGWCGLEPVRVNHALHYTPLRPHTRHFPHLPPGPAGDRLCATQPPPPPFPSLTHTSLCLLCLLFCLPLVVLFPLPVVFM